MKDKIIMFVIGALVGAILTAGGFLIFGQNKAGQMKGRGDMPDDMPERQFQSEDGTRPEKGNRGVNQTQDNETTVNENTQTNENITT